MIKVSIQYNAFSDRFGGYRVEGKSRAIRNYAVYELAKGTFDTLSEKFKSAKLKTDEDGLYEVWDIRENKEAQAACWVFQNTAKRIAAEFPSEVQVQILNKFEY